MKLSDQCNYSYVTDRNKQCPCHRMYSKWLNQQGKDKIKIFQDKVLSDYELSLPIDSEGRCLFHSNDVAWKQSNQFLERFLSLVELLAWELNSTKGLTTQEARMDFRGFVFTKDVGAYLINLSNIVFPYKVDLVCAVFVDNVDFEKSVFLNSLYLENAVFNGYAHFVGAEFRGNVYFDRCVFNNYAVFRQASFLGITSFNSTQFSSFATTYFESISVSKKMVFKGRSFDEKILSYTLVMSFVNDNLDGELLFENADVQRIERGSLQTLQKFEKEKKVRFGTGCNKYKLSKEVLLPYGKRYEPLLEEIVQSFIQYFNYGGVFRVNINVELEYMDNFVLIRYHADQDITQREFEKILSESIPGFIQLLMNPERYIKKIQSMDIGAWDMYRKAKSIQLGLVPRIQIGAEWSIEDTINLLSAFPGTINFEIQASIHSHFERIQLFSKQVMVEADTISIDESRVGELIMGDKFEQINNATIVNRSHVDNAFNTNTSEQKTSLAEAAAEIQKLLKQLEESNPTATEPEQVAYINVATKPDLKQRTIAALKEGGDTAIDEFVLENKYLKVVKAVVKGWLQPDG